MSVKEIINKIKLFLNEEPQEITLKDVKTMDGIILSFEELVVGADIFIVDEAGRNPAPTGEYILEDGVKVVVEEGKITELESPEPIEVPVEEMPAPEMAPAQEEMSVTDLSARIIALEAENKEIKTILAQLAESFSQKNFQEEVKMSMVKEELKEEPKEEMSFDMKPLTKKSDLSSILKNMYK